jgi:hypothetical protein
MFEQNSSGEHDAPLLFASVPFYGRLLKRQKLAMPMMFRFCNIHILYSVGYRNSEVRQIAYLLLRFDVKRMHSSVYSDMTFLIDSIPVGTFNRSSFSSNVFQYNALVFAHESLPLSNHTLIIQNGQLGGSKSVVMLDYIVYS